MAKKRIGILTGGGDVPGLNCRHQVGRLPWGGERMRSVGIRRGWEGLTHVNLNDPESKTRYILPLNRENTRTIDRTGGTFLHSSRTNPTKMKKVPPVLAGPEVRSQRIDQERRDQHRVRRDAGGVEEHRDAGPGLPDRDWRRRHPELRLANWIAKA